MENSRSFTVNIQKKREAFKELSKVEIRKSKGFVKFCYYLTLIMRIVAVLLGIYNIYNVICVSNEPLYLIFLIMTFGFPFGLSYIPWAVYHFSILREYRFRSEEVIDIGKTSMSYKYHDDRLPMEDTWLVYNISYSSINKMDYTEKTKELILQGDFVVKTYINGVLKEDELSSELRLLNIFNLDIADLLKEKVFV